MLTDKFQGQHDQEKKKQTPLQNLQGLTLPLANLCTMYVHTVEASLTWPYAKSEQTFQLDWKRMKPFFLIKDLLALKNIGPATVFTL